MSNRTFVSYGAIVLGQTHLQVAWSEIDWPATLDTENAMARVHLFSVGVEIASPFSRLRGPISIVPFPNFSLKIYRLYGVPN
jgi:hypothetical protein